MGSRLRRWILGVAVLALAGCAQIVPALLATYGPSMFASAIGDYGARAEFRVAGPYIEKKDWSGLTALARQKLQKEPNRPEWWQLAGYGHMQLGEMAAARDCFVRVTKLAPEEVNGWNLYAYSLKSLRDSRGALQAVNHAIEIDPYSGTAYVILGELYRDAGQRQAALKAYQRAIEINNGDPFAWLGVGLLGKRYGDAELYEKARKALKDLSPELSTQLEKA
jgi:tetratricopeptide (TPR) repeat protein